MKKIVFAALLCLAPAWAQVPYLPGTVYNVTPTGVVLNTPQGLTFVPNTAQFRVGDAVLQLSNLAVGRQVNAYYQPGWAPQYIPVDYYTQHPGWGWQQQVQGWQVEKVKWKKVPPGQAKKHGHGHGHGHGHD